MKRFLLACAVLLCSSGQAQVQDASLEGRTLWRGHVSFGFETSEFRPCGSKERWWVVSSADLQKRYTQATARMYESAYVVLRGIPSARGTYGHLGSYARELRVRSVVTLRGVQKDDCKLKGS